MRWLFSIRTLLGIQNQRLCIWNFWFYPCVPCMVTFTINIPQWSAYIIIYTIHGSYGIYCMIQDCHFQSSPVSPSGAMICIESASARPTATSSSTRRAPWWSRPRLGRIRSSMHRSVEGPGGPGGMGFREISGFPGMMTLCLQRWLEIAGFKWTFLWNHRIIAEGG